MPYGFQSKKNRPWGRFFLTLIKPERDFGRSDWIRTSDLLVAKAFSPVPRMMRRPKER